jgi:predicted transcriptional regulator
MEFLFVDDVMKIVGVSRSKAYKIIQQLRKELVQKGYFEYPAGRIPKKYFCERFYCDMSDIQVQEQAMAVGK